MKSRQLKKVFKIVAKQINSGDFKKLKPAHFHILDKAIRDSFDKVYLNEFRPWWYEQFDRWCELNLIDEIEKFYDRWIKKFQETSGINMEIYEIYHRLNHVKET